MHTALLALLLAIAQTDQPASQAAEQTKKEAASSNNLPRPTAEVVFSGQHSFASGFSDAEGEVSVTRAGVDASFTMATSQRGRLTLGLSAERSAYNFHDATGFVGGSSEPWDDVMTGGLSLRFSRQHDQQWSYFAGVDVASSAQDNAGISDSITYGGVVGVLFAQSERVRYGLALGVHTRLEDDATFLPLPLVAWQIDDQWSLASAPRRGGGQVGLNYAWCETLTLGVAVGFESRDFRLSDGAPVGGGVGRDSRIPVCFTASYKPHPQVSVSAEVGANFSQQFTLDDADGGRVSQLDADIGFFAGVGVTLTF